MRRSSLVMLAAALILGLIGVVLARTILRPRGTSPVVASATLPVVAAARALQFGDKISADALKLIELPAASRPADAFASIPLAVANGARVALRPIGVNEVITDAAISAKGNRLSMLGVIGPSMRAISVNVSEPTGVAGLVAPGDRVDIFVSYTPPEKAARTETIVSQRAMDSAAAAAAASSVVAAVAAPQPGASTNGRRPLAYVPPGVQSGGTALRTVSTDAARPTPISDLLVQNVRVLAIGQNANTLNEKPTPVRTATLEVTAEQAAKLVLGSNLPSGTLTLALRALTDESRAAVPTTYLADLHDGPRRAPAPIVHRSAMRVARAPRHEAAAHIEIVRGTQKGSVSESYAVPS